MTRKPLQARICSCMATEFFRSSMTKESNVQLGEERDRVTEIRQQECVCGLSLAPTPTRFDRMRLLCHVCVGGDRFWAASH